MKNPINGTVEFTETTFGAIATFSCVVGYNLTGNNGQDTRECLFGGWSGEDPTCESMTNKSFFQKLAYILYYFPQLLIVINYLLSLMVPSITVALSSGTQQHIPVMLGIMYC